MSGTVWYRSGTGKILITVEKVFLFRKTGVTVRYTITNRGSDDLNCLYSCEFEPEPVIAPPKLVLAAGLSDRTVELDSTVPGEVSQCHRLTPVDLESEEPLSVSADPSCRILQAPPVLRDRHRRRGTVLPGLRDLLNGLYPRPTGPGKPPRHPGRPGMTGSTASVRPPVRR
ncbi:MAG: hypothetical protein MZU97_12300 [Bacillus subtilis]|nr:hypothetical protein [Bacillus subtilis]